MNNNLSVNHNAIEIVQPKIKCAVNLLTLMPFEI